MFENIFAFMLDNNWAGYRNLDFRFLVYTCVDNKVLINLVVLFQVPHESRT